MICRLGSALCLSILLLLASCNGNDGDVTGSPTTGVVEARTLDSMLASITKSLTPPLAEQIFGPPNKREGSGLVIFVYDVEDGRKVNLGFPGPTAPISYASLQEKNGGTTPIVIKD